LASRKGRRRDRVPFGTKNLENGPVKEKGSKKKRNRKEGNTLFMVRLDYHLKALFVKQDDVI